MTANQSRLLGAALLLGAVSVLGFLARPGDAPDDGTDAAAAQEALERKRALDQAHARASARLAAGAYVLHSKTISDTEVIETIIIPEGNATELDTRCIVYRNTELQSSAITCRGPYFEPPRS